MIRVLLLTYKRPIYLEQTIVSFGARNRPWWKRKKALRLCVLIQGKECQETIEMTEKHHGYIHQVQMVAENVGCSGGYCLGMEWIFEMFDPKYVIFLQDDWFTSEPVGRYLHEMVTFLNENEDVGQIRLRNIDEKVARQNPHTFKRIKYERVTEHIMVTNAHFTLNPTLTRASVIKDILPFKGEKHAMDKFHTMGLKSAQLDAHCFSHVGLRRAYSYKPDGTPYWRY